MIRPVGRDTTTRYQGVYARHRKSCAKELDPARRCTCQPSFYGKVYDQQEGRHVRTRSFGTAQMARNARGDLVKAVAKGELPGRSAVRVRDAITAFLKAAESGVALNKNGRRYKHSAIVDLRGALRQHVQPRLGAKRLTDVRRKDCQAICDELTESGLSGSRIRSVVNAVRSLYRFARARELAEHDPAQDIQLPAMDATPVERVATPGELRRLLAVLEPEDALPYALAAYATARRSEALSVRWRDVDLDAGALTLGADPEARKYDASLRTVPILAALSAMLRRAYLAQGRPAPDAMVCPPRRYSRSGRMSSSPLATRARDRWGKATEKARADAKKAGRNPDDAVVWRPITLQEARHTAASWMDAAGVPAATRSKLMGHSLQIQGAAAVTSRYTHALPGDVEEARRLLDEFVAEREKAEAEAK